ncbi:Hint domain-containing protein [Aliiroseovarius sp.]|uniref:Hint domain-containing protein n=1 Tax=Aliiroseovarius sp. TaxID=1872442 RepID=UPI003BAC3D39
MPIYTVDFENLAAGDIVNNQYEGQGVTISSSSNNPAMVFDTDNPTGGDYDLATNNLGNVLIVSEDGDSSDPDDNAGGGSICFTFDEPTDVKNLTVLDNEEGGFVKFWDVDGNYLGKVYLPTTGNNGQALAELNCDNVGYMQVTLCGSGAIDNITYDSPILAEPEGDGYVEGTAGDDLIDASYTGDPEGDMIDNNDAILPGEGPQDDIVLAGAGDDTVIAGEGDDDVYAGSGDDTVDGGEGNDTIYGDGNLGSQTDLVREKFEWDEAPGYADEADAGGFTQDTGNVEVTFSIVDTNESPEVEFEDASGNIDGIDTGDLGGADKNSGLGLESNSKDEGATVALDFSDAVQNVDFNINDIDYDSEIWVKAYDADGNEITVNLSGGSKVTVTGNHAESNGGDGQPSSDDYSVQVSIPGPVARIEIIHNQDGSDGSHVQVTDVYFDAIVEVVDDGPAGNDTLMGGEGNDTIYGDTGNGSGGGSGGGSAEGQAKAQIVIDSQAGLYDGALLVEITDGTTGEVRVETLTNSYDSNIGAVYDVNLNEGDTIRVGITSPEGTFYSDSENAKANVLTSDSTQLSFEDTAGLGDADFKDVVVTVNLTGDVELGLPGGGSASGTPLSTGHDVISGGEGDDTIYGEVGNDTLSGDGGTNYLSGGTGDDTFIGGDGADTFKGGAGQDNLDYSGSDAAVNVDLSTSTLSGGDADNDTIQQGIDGVIGSEYDDVLTGFDQQGTNPADTFTNEFWGNGGNDTISGKDGDDFIDGGADDDTITGGGGADTLLGGDDRDTFIGGTAGDFVDGGEGGNDWDVLDLSGEGPLSVEYDPGNPENGTVTFYDGDGNVTGTMEFVNIERVILPPEDPDAQDDTAETDEDTPVDIDVLANDSDPNGDPLEVTSATADNGDVTINPDGTITYTPDENFNGTDTITYEISDGNGGTDTATVTVTVNPVNDDPEANDDTATTPFNTAVTIPVLDNDTDVDGDPLEVIGASSPNGDVTINPDGTITFDPTPGFEGTAIITYEVSDGNGGTDTAEVEVTVEEQPLDGIVEGTGGDDLIDLDYTGDPEGDMVDNNDEILPGEGPNDDIIEAYEGDDTVFAGEGNDEIDGGEGDDTLHGEDGDDEIIGGDGSDTVFGGEGNDIIDTSGSDPRTDYGWPGVIPPDADPFDDRDTVHGGAGDDTITTGDDQDIITGGTGEDTIDGGLDDDTIDGGADDDFIIGGHGSDTIQGGDGNDEIWGGLGAGTDPFNAPDVDQPGDSFPIDDPVPNNGIDVIHGGAGNDTIYGQDDADQLFGDEGQDYIDGGIDNDEIHGGDDADTLLGGQGDDTIFGDDGADTIDGGTGDDVVDGGRGSDIIFGGEGDDVLDGGTGGDFIDGGAGDDTVIGTTGRDELHGGDDNDTITGGLGEDEISGDAGDDVIDAGGDDDVVDGGAGNDQITGGLGNDDLSGGDDRDTFTGLNAGDTVDGGAGGDDWDVLDLTGSAPSGGSLKVTITGPDSNGNGSDGYVTYFDSAGNVTGTLQFEEIEEIVPCFTPGTLIATPKGERRVEELQEGDRVITRDNGIQEIRWVGHKPMDWRQLEANKHLKPVLIQAGSLGNGLPERDMLVSPNHRVLVANDRTALYFEEREVLVSAKHLVDNKGVHRVDTMGTTYIHFMFDHHEVVLSDGAWTESFQPGDYSLKGVGNAQRTEIFELFPELETSQGIEDYTAARRTLKAHEAKMLIK